MRQGKPRELSLCAPFAAPDQCPADAPVIWLADLERTRLTAIAHPVQRQGGGDTLFPPPPVRVHVHFDGFGRQTVTLENNVCRETLVVGGALLTLGSARLTIDRIELSELPNAVYRLNALAHLLFGQRYRGPPTRPAAVDARHLRNAIVAYDGENAGASRRQIAAVIYGNRAASDDWSDPSGRLKAMVKRDVLRGRRLVFGGWRDFVMAGTFRAEA